MNTYLEQYLLKQLAISQGIEVKTAVGRPIGPEFDYELDKFHLLPDNADFIHALSYKTNPSFCEMMAQRLWFEDSGLYERCRSVYSRRFLASKHYQPAAKATFGRTNQIAKLVLGDTFVPRSIPKKKDLLASIDDVKSRDVTCDVYEYESCISRFKSFISKNLDGIDSEWKDRIQLLNQMQLEDSEIMGMTNIRLSRFSKLVDSEWKWAEKGEFKAFAADDSYELNLEKQSSYFEVMVFYSPHVGQTREYLLNSMEMYILDEFQKGAMLADIMQRIIDESSGNLSNYELTELRRKMIEKVRLWLYLGFITFSTESALEVDLTPDALSCS